jgi:hypothetical protein
MQNKCRNLCYSIIAPTLLTRRQQASAMSRDKIEVSSICDADCAATPASPISSLVYRSRYPRAISSLVIPTWVTERRTRSVAVMHLIYESCQSQYKVKRRKGLEGGKMTRNDSVDRFMCGLIGGVENLVHFR